MSSHYRHRRGLQNNAAASPKAIRASLAEGMEPEVDSLHRLVWDKLPQAAYSRSYLSFLIGFFQAAINRDLQPMGVVHPSEK